MSLKVKEAYLGCNPILLKSQDTRLGAQTLLLLIRYSCIIRLFSKYRQVPNPPRESVFGSRGSPLAALSSALSSQAGLFKCFKHQTLTQSNYLLLARVETLHTSFLGTSSSEAER